MYSVLRSDCIETVVVRSLSLVVGHLVVVAVVVVVVVLWILLHICMGNDLCNYYHV